MARILVSGLVNLETTVKVDGFPVPWFPVRYPFFGVASSVSGVGYNVARALQALGSSPLLLSLVASDLAGRQVRGAQRGGQKRSRPCRDRASRTWRPARSGATSERRRGAFPRAWRARATLYPTPETEEATPKNG